MFSNSLFLQLILAGMGIALVFVYVQPTLANIGDIQDAIIQYKEERENVSKVNARLVSLVDTVNHISAADQEALLIFMPDKVDKTAVSRDIYNLAVFSNVVVNSVKYEKKTDTKTPVVLGSHKTPPVPHKFSVSIKGGYESIKNFFLLIEQSNYPLEIHELKISSAEDDEITAEIAIVTYSRI